MYSWSHILRKISLKKSFGIVVFNFSAEIKMTQMKISYVATILKQDKYMMHF